MEKGIGHVRSVIVFGKSDPVPRELQATGLHLAGLGFGGVGLAVTHLVVRTGIVRVQHFETRESIKVPQKENEGERKRDASRICVGRTKASPRPEDDGLLAVSILGQPKHTRVRHGATILERCRNAVQPNHAANHAGSASALTVAIPGSRASTESGTGKTSLRSEGDLLDNSIVDSTAAVRCFRPITRARRVMTVHCDTSKATLTSKITSRPVRPGFCGPSFPV